MRTEYQSKRVFGQRTVDWEERINVCRLRKEKFEKLQPQMKESDFSSMLLTLEENVRYATGRYGENWTRAAYAIVTQMGDPILFECVGDLEFIQMSCPWLKNKLHPATTYQHAPGQASTFPFEDEDLS